MTPATETAGATEILGMLSEQRDLCRRLSGFAETQRSLITGNEPERLLALLGDRQQLLERLTAIGQRMKPVQAQWAEVRAQMSPGQGQAADALLNEVNRLLAGILQIDEADARLLSARKKMTAQTMQVVERGRQVGAAYAAASSRESRGVGNIDWTDQ